MELPDSIPSGDKKRGPGHKLTETQWLTTKANKNKLRRQKGGEDKPAEEGKLNCSTASRSWIRHKSMNKRLEEW